MTTPTEPVHPRDWIDLPAQLAAARILDEEGRARGWWETSAPLHRIDQFGNGNWWDSLSICEFLDAVANVTLAYKLAKRAAAAMAVTPAEDAARTLEGEARAHNWAGGGFSLDGLAPEDRAGVVALAARMGETYLAKCAGLADEVRDMLRPFVLEKIRVDSYSYASPKEVKNWAERYKFWSIAAPARYRPAWGQIAAYADTLSKGGKPGDEERFKADYLALVPSDLTSARELCA